MTQAAPSDPSRTGPGGPRRVLVTGGAGFIGSHVVDLLLARGDLVTVVDNFATGRRDNLPPGPRPGLTIVENDLALFLQHAERSAGPRFDLIFHFAAAVGVQLVLEDPIGSIRTNIEQTQTLLEYAARSGMPGVLLASSSEVYGKGVKTPFRESDDVLYGPTTMTRWSYACSKAIDEHLALAYHRQQGLPVVIVRFFNTVGPRQIGAHGMVLPRFVSAALRGEPLELFGDGTQSRTFCDVRDAAPALLRLMDHPRARGEVFNLGSDRVVTVRGLADVVIRTLGSRSSVRHVPYSEAYPQGFEDLVTRCPDVTKVRELIGFDPRTPLEATIRDLAAEMTSRSQVGA